VSLFEVRPSHGSYVPINGICRVPGFSAGEDDLLLQWQFLLLPGLTTVKKDALRIRDAREAPRD